MSHDACCAEQQLRPLRLRDASRACLARPAHQCDAAREVQVLVLQHVVDNGSLTGIDDAGKNKSLLTPSSSSCLILCAALRGHSHEHLFIINASQCLLYPT